MLNSECVSEEYITRSGLTAQRCYTQARDKGILVF
jgi:hypothetical protein